MADPKNLISEIAAKAQAQRSTLGMVSYTPRPSIRVEAGQTGYLVFWETGYGPAATHGCSTWDEVMEIMASFPTVHIGEARD